MDKEYTACTSYSKNPKAKYKNFAFNLYPFQLNSEQKKKEFPVTHIESKRNEAGGKKGMNCFLIASFDGLL